MGTGSTRTLIKSQRGKWQDGAGVGVSNGSVSNPKIRNQCNNQPVKDNGLIAKAMKDPVAR
jgi:hypothetical protein